MRLASVVSPRSGTSATSQPTWLSSRDWVTVRSGAMMAEIPEVAATATLRPNSEARILDMASCCSGCAVPP